MSLARTRPSLATGVVFWAFLEISSEAPRTAAPAITPAAVAAVATLSLLALAARSRWLRDTDRRSPLARLSIRRRSGGVPAYDRRLLAGLSDRKLSGSGVLRRDKLALDDARRAVGPLLSAALGDGCGCWLLSETLLCEAAKGAAGARLAVGSCCCCWRADRFLTVIVFSGSGVFGVGDGSRSRGVSGPTTLSW
jgi:hypothetical protein